MTWRELDVFMEWQWRKGEKRREKAAEELADIVERHRTMEVEIYEQQPGQSIDDFLNGLLDSEDGV